jgi:UDP-N-acetylmuramyl tripeptide synthase
MLKLASLVALGAGWLSRRLGRGGGTTLPGVVLLRLRPNAIAELAAGLPHGAILISATNGKTTTTRLVVAAAEALGLRVVTNAEGSNLERGVAAALLHGARGGDGGAPDIAILEVDEAALPAVARAVQPRALVLMNLFRDQLDRYGELDTLVDIWRDLLDSDAVSEDCSLVLNADDPNLADLGRDRSKVVWFGLDDVSHALEARAHAADATSCRRCGHPIKHDVVLLGHLGHWHCTNGDAVRPTPSVTATSAALRSDGQTVTVAIDGSPVEIDSSLAGLHSTYNVTAAMAAAHVMPTIHGNRAAVARAIGATGAAFGRGERIAIDGRHINLLLAKNPTGVNQNIRTVLAEDGQVHVLAVLNDRTADGRDVSWIWDVDWEPLDGRLASLTLAGDRAWDLALRFRYAGFAMDTVQVKPDVASALDTAVAATDHGSTLHVLPTYTAMLDLRSELARRGHVAEYWDES